MEKSFKQSVIEGLKYYFYALVDPRDNRIFYVGKGTGNRVYQHAQAALTDDSQNLKLSPYLNTDVFDYPFGSGGAVTYIPRNNF